MFHKNSFPNAIAHIDCNAFFASVEQAYDPSLKGKPVLVTGLGGHMIITASYEARKFNIKTGMPIWEAKKLCPKAVTVKSNFQRYLLFNRNFIEILKNYTPDVEEASIDEAYLNLTGIRRLFRKSYSEICLDIKNKIKSKLGITVSIGLSVSKALAKTASNYQKPDALTVVPAKDIINFLEKIPLKDIKGIGHNTYALLIKKNIHTTLDFINCNPNLIKKWLGKTGWDLQADLRGEYIRKVNTQIQIPKSLARTRSFTTTQDQNFLYKEIIQNLSLAFWNLRKRKLKTKLIFLMLRDKNYHTYYSKIILPEGINSEISILKLLKQAFLNIYKDHLSYRSTGIITTLLEYEDFIQPSLFSNPFESDKQISLFQNIDHINQKYGYQNIEIASGHEFNRNTIKGTQLNLPYLQ